MTLSIIHPFVSPLADDGDPNTVSPSNWNAVHSVSGAADATQLNANVVQSVVNDTNVTGSIAAQALTLGWTGTLGAVRLNGNVVQAIANDTNITGTIAAQTLTLAWSGTLALSRLAQGTDGQIIVAQTSAASLYKTVSGDATLSAAGALTVAKIQGTTVSGTTGSGNVVFSTSPTLVTPVLGTPSSGTLTNATGLPISTGVSGLGTGVATFLATPSSANLASALTDETGSGAAVFATSPTLVTPTLGVATGTSLTLGNGAVNAPSINLGDSTTGLYRPASNVVGVTTNGILAGYWSATQQLGINCVPGTGLALDVNANASGTANANLPTNGVRYVAPDTSTGGYNVQTFGAQGVNAFARADGTEASPVAVASGLTIGAFSFQPYSGSAYSTLAQIRGQTAELQSGTAGGTNVDVLTTPKTTRTLTHIARFHASGGLAVGSTNAATDPGNNALLVTDLYSSNASFMIRTKTTLSSGAAANTGTLTNGPAVGNPTKWIPIDDNGTTRYIPAW